MTNNRTYGIHKDEYLYIVLSTTSSLKLVVIDSIFPNPHFYQIKPLIRVIKILLS